MLRRGVDVGIIIIVGVRSFHFLPVVIEADRGFVLGVLFYLQLQVRVIIRYFLWIFFYRFRPGAEDFEKRD